MTDRTARRAGPSPGALVLALLLASGLWPLACRAAGGADEVIEKGGVRFYPKQKRVEMDGKFILGEGPIELFVCGEGGKDYESVIQVKADPEILHFCLLLMGLKPGKTGPKFQGDPDNVPTGSPVIVRVRWKEGNEEKLVRGEDLCWNAIDKRPMRRSPWVFVGSKKQKDPETGKWVYWAKVEQSLITVFRDPFAVLDLPLPLGANDEAYVANKAVLAKLVGRKCTVLLTPGPAFEPPKRNAAGGAISHLDVTGGGRLLIDRVQPEDPVAALLKIAKGRPKDTYRVTIDHGAPAKAIADALEAISEARLKLESLGMARVKPELKTAVTVTVATDGLRIKGKAVTPAEARTIVQQFAVGETPFGVTVQVEHGAGLGAAAKACRVCEAITTAVIRLVMPPRHPAR